MKPWVGAVAVATAILAAPSVALAGEDDPAQLQFKLPSAEAVHDFEALGLSMDHGITRNPDGTAVISAWATDEQAQLARVHGYERGRDDHEQVRDRRHPRRARRDAEEDQGAPRTPCVRTPPARRAPAPLRAASGPSARTTSRTTSAASSRSRPTSTARHFGGTNGTTYSGPTVMAEWFDAAGNRIGGPSAVGVYRDPRRQPRTTTSTTTRSSGSATRATAPSCPRRSRSRPRPATSTRSTCKRVDRRRTRPSRPRR